MNVDQKRVLVVGLGASGLGAVRVLASRGAHVLANDVRDEVTLGERIAAARRAGARDVVLGSHDPALFRSVDLIVLSPGVPPSDALAAADEDGVPVVSEIELASWFVQGTVLAVTGTNGKSTVTALLGDMCRATGRPTFVGGNLGTPLTDVVDGAAAGPDGLVVVEVSSFQLERVDRFRPHVAVLLNVSEDHLDRYPSFAAYAAAKGRVFHGQSPADHAVVPAGDEVCLSLARAGAARVRTFGGVDGEVRIQGDAVVNGASGLRVALGDLRMRGAHNAENACAAALAARLAGVSPDRVADALCTFAGLPHRMQHVREVDGVTYFDDSKATNVGAAVVAVDGLANAGGDVVLIAGGKDKGGSYEPLCRALQSHGRGVVLLGEAAERIAHTLTTLPIPVERASTMEEAVQAARRLARPGDSVLLAPACSSFDMFGSYAERGEAFQRAVRALGEGER